jgi:stage IV sporulation protein FB
MFEEPPETRIDLCFDLLGVPVRVHPMFWLIVAALGLGLPLAEQMVWVGVVFLSVLVHEMGHALTSRLMGRRTHVVLYSLGGLTVPEGETSETLDWGHAAIALSGPASGFLLALFAYLVIPLAGSTESGLLGALYFYVFWINAVWGLVNLLPVWPLDGGYATRTLLLRVGGDWGYAVSSIISIVTAAVVAILAWQMAQPLMALLSGFFALKEWQRSLSG